MMEIVLSKIKKYQRKNKYLNRYLKLFKKWYASKVDGYPSWSKILDRDVEGWKKALNNSKQGPKILIGTSIGQYYSGTTLESVLAAALILRGADIHVLLCDEFLPACLACEYTWYPREGRFAKFGPQKDICKHCYQPAHAMFKTLGVTVHRYSEYVTESEMVEAEKLSKETPVNEIEGYKYENCAVGEHALAGALRFYGRCNLDEEPFAEPILRRYFKAALLTVFAVQKLIRKNGFTTAVFHHGIYVPQGLIGEVARSENVKVVNWNPAYRKQRFIFSHGDTYHHTLMSEPVDKWEALEWNTKLDAELADYLKSRWDGSQDWIWFHDQPYFDLGEIEKEIGIDFSKPCIGMLTNVLWDAQLHYPANAFSDMREWVLRTVEYFEKRPDLNLLIRTHPAEINGAILARQTITDELKKEFPVLPKNVFVIPPESRISTYVAMAQCDTVIIYGTKTGVELTSAGIPVIVAGEAWIRNKGITFDASSISEYFSLLDRLPMSERMNKNKIIRARKYAFHFFFRRMIPLEFLTPVKRNPPYNVSIKKMSDLLPGNYEGLDTICNGILNGDDFIYPAERLSH